jgi:hypothetical protein
MYKGQNAFCGDTAKLIILTEIYEVSVRVYFEYEDHISHQLLQMVKL